MRDAPSVLVVAYGAPDDLRNCLASLRGEFDVLVVDNSSDQRVHATVADAGATYVDPGANLGFAGGVNYGMRRLATDRDVLLLNPDATTTPSVVHSLHETLRKSPRLGAV